MQSVILAAGRGTRMEELTSSVPKPMLVIGGKTLLEHKLDALPAEVDEVIFVVGYLSDVIRNRFGAKYTEKKISYQEQTQLDGTAGALWRAQPLLKEKFLVMMGDDIYARHDIQQCIVVKEWGLLVQQIPHLRRAGGVRLNAEGNIEAIIEGDRWEEAGIASTNMFVLDTRLFSQPMIPKQEGSPEFGLPQTVVAAAHALGVKLEPVFTDQWIQVTSPKDLVHAEGELKKMNN